MHNDTMRLLRFLTPVAFRGRTLAENSAVIMLVVSIVYAFFRVGFVGGLRAPLYPGGWPMLGPSDQFMGLPIVAFCAIAFLAGVGGFIRLRGIFAFLAFSTICIDLCAFTFTIPYWARGEHFIPWPYQNGLMIDLQMWFLVVVPFLLVYVLLTRAEDIYRYLLDL